MKRSMVAALLADGSYGNDRSCRRRLKELWVSAGIVVVLTRGRGDRGPLFSEDRQRVGRVRGAANGGCDAGGVAR